MASVDRALQLVVMLRNGERLSVTAAAEKLGTAPSTAHRLLTALVRRGFAVQDHERRYRSGPESSSGRDVSLSPVRLKTAATDMMHEVSARVGETVQLMVLEGPRVHFIHGVEPERALKVSAVLDTYLPAHCSGGGKALLAELGTAELNDLYSAGFPDAVNPLIRSYSELTERLAETRSNGYGTTYDEHEDGVSGVGVAVRDNAAHSVGALTVAIPTTRFSEQMIPTWVDELRRASADISARLG